jgi:hypothetical protein
MATHLMGKETGSEMPRYLYRVTKLGRDRAEGFKPKSFPLKYAAFFSLAPGFAASGRPSNHFHHRWGNNLSVTECPWEAIGFYGLRSSWKKEELGLWAPWLGTTKIRVAVCL